MNMKRRYGIHILLGLAIGVGLLGTAHSPAFKNVYLEIVLGIAAGMATNWLISTMAHENEIINNSDISSI